MSGLAFTGNLLVVPATFEAYSGLGVNPARDPSLPSAAGTGAAYVFAERTDGWHFDGCLKASNAAGGDVFGMSVAALDDTIILSAPGEDSDADGISVNDATAQSNNDASDSGAVYIFAPNCANVPTGASVPGC